jgi:hypothetical protein
MPETRGLAEDQHAWRRLGRHGRSGDEGEQAREDEKKTVHEAILPSRVHRCARRALPAASAVA